MKKNIALFLMLFSMPSIAGECVILLHGLARSDRSMQAMEKALLAKEYQVVNMDYSSTAAAIEVLAIDTIDKGLALCSADSRIHFVTHSMGGILVRYYLVEKTVEHLGRVVMMGPPNKGSEVVDTLGSIPLFEWVNGPAGLQLGTGNMSVPNQLGAADFDLGVIAGSQSINWILSIMLPGDDDGKVTIENTRLEGMDDHIVMEVTHPFMMQNEKVIQQVIYYLQNGKFKRDVTVK